MLCLAVDFWRAVKACTGQNLNRHLIHVVFQLFDVDDDGKLSHKEFIAVMKERLQRGSRVCAFTDYVIILVSRMSSWGTFRENFSNPLSFQTYSASSWNQAWKVLSADLSDIVIFYLLSYINWVKSSPWRFVLLYVCSLNASTLGLKQNHCHCLIGL